MVNHRVSNPGPLTYESGALPTALRGPALNETNLSTWHMISKLSLVKNQQVPSKYITKLENNIHVTQNSYRDPGVLLIWIIIEQGPTVLTVDAGLFVWTFDIPFFFLPVSERRLDIDRNIVSKSRYTQNNKPTNKTLK